MAKPQVRIQDRVPQFELRHRLALALEKARVNLDEMAKIVGAHPNTIRNYLTGRTEPPRSVLIAWALRCEVPLEWLISGDPNPPSTSWYGDQLELALSVAA